jgi:putative redox protein
VADRVITAAWQGEFRVDITAGAFHLRVDEPERVGGSDTGPQPTDLLLASVASCVALSVAFSARKRGIELSRIDVTVGGDYEGPRFRAISVTVSTDAPADAIDGLMAAAQRVCYVTNTLREPPEITLVHQSV